MELTQSQKSDFISEILSSEAGINEIIRVLLDTFSKQERALWDITFKIFNSISSMRFRAKY